MREGPEYCQFQGAAYLPLLLIINTDDPAWVTDHDSVIGDGLCDDGKGADPRVVADVYRANHHTMRPEVDPVAEGRYSEIIPAPVGLVANRDSLAEMAVAADNSVGVDDDRMLVVQAQPRANRCGHRQFH